MNSRFTDAMKKKIVEERRCGVPMKELCTKYHVCAKTIRTWINKISETDDRDLTYSVRRRQRKNRFSEDFCKAIVARYEAGEAISALCEEVKIGRSTLYRWIKLYTEYRRNNGEKFTIQDINRLIEENRMLAEENQVFRSCQCHPSDPLRIKMAEMKKWKDKFTVHALCRAMEVSRGTFYNYLFRSKPKTVYEKTDEMLRPLIQAVFTESKERFGANKIRIKLAEHGVKVSAEHIRRLMNEMGLIAKQARLRCFNSTNRKYMYRRNRVQQNFTQDAPNLLWVSDVTYARINQDFYAICVVIDVFSRKVLSYKISDKNDTALVLTAFKTAFAARNNPQGVTFHSDQGLQYSSYKFRKHLRDCGVIQSFSNPGTPYDNAVAESFFSIMKREELSHNYYHSFEELEKTVSEYIDFFNGMRPHQKMGNLTPDEIERRYYEN